MRSASWELLDLSALCGGWDWQYLLPADIVSVVGIIGFIGLAAPNIVRMAGARRLGPRLLWSVLLGAVPSATTIRCCSSSVAWWRPSIPTGAITRRPGCRPMLAHSAPEPQGDQPPKGWCFRRRHPRLPVELPVNSASSRTWAPRRSGCSLDRGSTAGTCCRRITGMRCSGACPG